MLAYFEKQAKDNGFEIVSLGSAEGYAEKFYLDNGYEPTYFYIKIKKDKLSTDYKNKGYDFSKEEDEDDKKILWMPYTKYDLSKREEVKKRLNAYEVIFILEKKL